MKLAVLIPQFPGQTHAFFWNEIRSLEENGVEVHIFSTRKPEKSLNTHGWSLEAAERTTYLGLGGMRHRAEAVLRLPGWVRQVRAEDASRQALASTLISAPAAIALRDACTARGIDHVHAHSAGNSAMIAKLCQLAGGPGYSVTLHGPVRDYGPAQSFKWGGARFGITITEVTRADLLGALGPQAPRKMFVCPMGVDTDRFRRQSPYEPWAPGEELRLFSCGRLNRVKGHDTAIAALDILRAKGVDARLTIAGEDDAGGTGYRKILEDIIAKSPAPDRVTLLGAVSVDTVLDELEKAHVFVLASRTEALGVAYMEAMACGCPSVGTRAGGVTELITDGEDGLLVAPESPEALAEAIVRIANDRDLALRLSETGRAKIVEQFSHHRSARRLEAAILEATDDTEDV